MIRILILVWRHYMHMTRKKGSHPLCLPAEVEEGEEAVVWEQIQLNSVQQSWQGRWRDAYNLRVPKQCKSESEPKKVK